MWKNAIIEKRSNSSVILSRVANEQRQNFCIFLKIFSKVISFSIFYNKFQPSCLYCLRDIRIERTVAAKKAKWIIFNGAMKMKRYYQKINFGKTRSLRSLYHAVVEWQCLVSIPHCICGRMRMWQKAARFRTKKRNPFVSKLLIFQNGTSRIRYQREFGRPRSDAYQYTNLMSPIVEWYFDPKKFQEYFISKPLVKTLIAEGKQIFSKKMILRLL